MANVLVIKNANFATNRVAVISFDGKPCTGIELDESTITVTGIDPVTVGYEVTPSDTTDEIIWSSSDTSVATVDGNVVTIVGIGSTTITATCGSYSDSLTLTADLYESPDWYQVTTYGMQTNSGLTTIGARIKDTSGTYSRMLAGRDANDSSFPYKLMDTGDYTKDNGIRPLKIPNNVARIHVTASGNDLYNSGTGYAGFGVCFASGNESVLYAGAYTVVKGIGEEMGSIPVTSHAVNGSVEIPSGADSYVMGVRLYPEPSTDTLPSTIASNDNIVIHYLPAASE